MNWTPTPRHIRSIRRYAADAAGFRTTAGMIICVGLRYSTVTGKQSFNTLALTEDPDFRDTDMYDNCTRLEDLKDVELTQGRGLVDFYVYGANEELEINVQAHLAATRTRNVIWKMTGTMVPARILLQGLAERFAAEKVGIDG